MKEKETRIRIVLDNGADEALIGVGDLNRDLTGIRSPWPAPLKRHQL
jgi:hypothetical protein